MRYSSVLLALPAVALAQQQIPLVDQIKGWFNKATASISSVVPNIPTSIAVPNPAAAAAAKYAELKVVPVTLENHKTLLQPGAATASPGIEEWLIYVTGGNKTCFGMCQRAETAWNESVALISASAKNPPNLGMINCEQEAVLCHAWATHPPCLLHMQLPQPFADQSTPSSTVRHMNINRTSVNAPDLAALVLQNKILDLKPYDSIFQPFDGLLAKTGLQLPFGYASWGFSKIPSWVFMIGVSFISRNFMGRRTGQQAQGPARAQPAAAAPAAPAAAK
ncbi:hypothetical protein AMS68_002365 [Peltaster fructicola]|uniref:Uncharacterized protein n=1 Tax=Peltaster fructicola TaxID=286661 RepID=A0A6H0XQD2_9PEZI|nr:hypothetical protein AMS68_002365 [Peltaster fructicola]